jgi:hypothetical protein
MLRVMGCEREVDGAASGSSPVSGFDIGGVEP